MNQAGYLTVSIFVLVGLAALALTLYLVLRKGPKSERKHCAECADMTCPLAKALEEKR